MLNTDPANATTITDLNTGIRIDRNVAGITTGANAIFEIIGGPVYVNMFYGIVTVAIQAAATLLHFDMDVTAGAGLDLALSVDSADLTGDVATTVYIPPATVAGAMTVHALGLNIFPTWILPIGELMLHASATRTGTIVWSMFYYPLTEGAYVVAHA
jgi:hypothetical protein